jgi:predicted Zn-dependent protease
MDLLVLAPKAVEIALSAIDQVTDGALQQAGADLLSFLKTRFLGRLQITKATEDKKLLEAAIISEANSDQKFQKDLEKLVTQYNNIQNSYNISQSTESGVNISVDNNPGTVIGQQIGQQFFR